ncbi:MAG: PD-(D/E)XK nuclease family protein, partial [Candidatus Omnitrophica bacterium]|nr:PD-(D/E)XK nuclease family protein [Candidatus Omnitrophota bacterium]
AKNKAVPAFIEKDFSFSWEEVRITGRFDRVDQGPEGAVIMDFKTSEIKTVKDAEKRVKESLQLDLYALAYGCIFGSLPKRVALYFLESGIIGARDVREADLDKIKDKIRQVAEGIRRRQFGATPAYMACTYCAYSQICPSSAARE